MEEHDAEAVAASISGLSDQGREEEARRNLAALHPADLADLMELLSQEERTELFALLDRDHAGEVLLEVDEATRGEMLEELDAPELAEVVETMPPDEAADIVGDLSDERSEEVLEELPADASEQIEDILEYDEESAGGIMTPVLFRAQEDMTVGRAIGLIQSHEIDDEAAFYLYVVGSEDRLVGVVPLRKLVTSRPSTLLSSILSREVKSVPVDADQEDIADAFRKYDHLAMPVVDQTGKLLGQVTVDEVVDVIMEEATEDVYKMAGTDDAELATHSVFKVARIRIAWLFVCLAGTMFAGVVIRMFEATLAEMLGLMAFVPAIMAMGGNSGVQTSTVMVRGLATGAVEPKRILRALFHEVRVALVMGVVCGATAGLIANVWLGEPTVGFVVGVSMFLGILIAASFGALLPILINRAGGDPAVACGPLITTVNDVVSLLIYLGTATLLLA